MTPTATAPQRGICASFATIRTLTNIFVGSVALMFAMTATATKIVWTFDNATFLDSNPPVLQGGAASGSFTFDTVTQTYSDINIATSTSNGPLNTYDNAVSLLEENASNLAVVSSASPPSPGPGEIGGPRTGWLTSNHKTLIQCSGRTEVQSTMLHYEARQKMVR